MSVAESDVQKGLVVISITLLALIAKWIKSSLG
jgi:hypothetical protein